MAKVKSLKLAIIVGTRPEIIKMAPVIWACRKQGVNYQVIYTSQQDFKKMGQVFFTELGLPKPDYILKTPTVTDYRVQLGRITANLLSVLRKESPDVVVVQGDTTSVLAGALAACQLNIAVAHHEAGLRSHDSAMLEEINRIITDRISTFLFAPTRTAVKNLRQEKVSGRVSLTGNTIVDAVRRHQPKQTASPILQRLGLQPGRYFLATFHRRENVDVKPRFTGIITGLAAVSRNFSDHPVICPIHPRSLAKSRELAIKLPSNLKIIPPTGFLDALQLEANSQLILTDSGGLQEEAAILRVPCVTLRDNTERPETIAGGMNILAGADPKRILAGARQMLAGRIRWSNPFGDGRAGERIVRQLREHHENS